MAHYLVPLALKVVAEGTWGRAGNKVDHRSGLLHARHFSAGVKAEHWSSYMAPCLLYPSTFVEAPTWRRVKFRKAFTELWPTKGWGSPPTWWQPLVGNSSVKALRNLTLLHVGASTNVDG